MNDKARELGLTDSCFVTPHGLPAEGQYGSAADLGRLMLRCMEVPELSEILGTCQIQIRDRTLRNHLRLLWTLPGCLGGKTGYTRASGRCLVSCCEREGTRLVCVTLDDADDWNDHAALYDWGFAHYARRDLTGELSWTLPVIGGTVAETEARADALERFLPRDAELRFETELPPFLFAPARAGEICGLATVYRGEEELGSAPLKSAQSLFEMMHRPEVTYDNTSSLDPERPALSRHQKTSMEVEIKYGGYIQKQLAQIEKFKRLENKKLSADMDYSKIDGLRIEAQQKLNALKPVSIGQASRISGVSPADINVLLIYLEKQRRSR
jgi:hypothetical protein